VGGLLAGSVYAREFQPLIVRVETGVIIKIKIVTRHSRQLLLKMKCGKRKTVPREGLTSDWRLHT
jgi:hypothetical protein